METGVESRPRRTGSPQRNASEGTPAHSPAAAHTQKKTFSTIFSCLVSLLKLKVPNNGPWSPHLSVDAAGQAGAAAHWGDHCNPCRRRGRLTLLRGKSWWRATEQQTETAELNNTNVGCFCSRGKVNTDNLASTQNALSQDAHTNPCMNTGTHTLSSLRWNSEMKVRVFHVSLSQLWHEAVLLIKPKLIELIPGQNGVKSGTQCTMIWRPA